jgi:uncharacterized cupredoxin-like copper-binding protein
MPSPRRTFLIVLPAIVLVAAACTSASPSPGGGGGESTTVNVTLQEWSVLPEVSSADAGEITFHVTNDGPDDIHEFVVIKTDLAPGDLPTDETGAVDEEGEGMEVVDEIEDLEVGASEDVTVTLEAGSYVLLCNIYSEDEEEAHYEEGMRTAFTVE